MFKKIIMALAVALPLTAAAQKFGTVQIDNVFSAMPETTEMQNTLNDASKKYETEFQKLQEELNKLYTDFQTIQNDTATPDAIKERRMQEIQDKASKVEQFRQTATQDLQRQQEQLVAPIQSKINDAIKAVGTEGSFTLILPAEPAIILYQGADVVDVTPLVKAKLGLK